MKKQEIHLASYSILYVPNQTCTQVTKHDEILQKKKWVKAINKKNWDELAHKTFLKPSVNLSTIFRGLGFFSKKN